jgi:WD40 repeat protein
MNRHHQRWLVMAFIALFLQSEMLNAQLFINLQDQSPASVTFSPDGKYILSGGHDGTIRLWDVTTGKALYLIYIDKMESGGTSLPSDVMSVTFSPDGRLFAAGIRDRTVRVYGTATGLELFILKEPNQGGLRSIAFSPDGHYIVSGGHDRRVRLWSIPPGTEEDRHIQTHNEVVMAVAFSPDGKTIASGSRDGTVLLWSTITNQQYVLETGGAGVTAVTFSPDSKFLAAATETSPFAIFLWELRPGIQAIKLTGHKGPVNGLAFTPDGSYIGSGSIDGTIRLWEIKAQHEAKTIPLPQDAQAIRSIAFSPSGELLVSGSYHENPRIWDFKSGELIRVLGD